MLNFAPRSALRVLCVEEDAVQRKLLQACFDVAGADALFAESAARALSLFRRFDLELVLLDIDRHSAEELAAFEDMRDAPQWSAPIVAVTNNDCRWTEESYREVGFAALYVKPIEPSRLLQSMDGALRAAGLAPLLRDSAHAFETGHAYLH